MKKLLKFKSRNSKIQFLQSFVLGGLATVFELGVIWFLKEILGIHPVYSAALGYSTYIVINYIGSTKLIFHHRYFKNRFIELGIFVLIGLIGMMLYAQFMKFFWEYVGLHYLIACVCASPLVYIWNFFSRKYILFSDSAFKFFKKFERFE